MSEVTWQRDPEFSRANRAEHALVGDYELIAFDLPATLAGPAVIGWELFGPPRHQELIDHGGGIRFLQRLPQRFVRLERGLYPLIVVRPLDITQVRRVPPHMPTRLGRASVEPNKSAATKRAATKPRV